VDLVRQEGKCWEKIGSELKRSRYSCHKRYRQLKKERRKQGIEDNDAEGSQCEVGEEAEWDAVETARLYSEYIIPIQH